MPRPVAGAGRGAWPGYFRNFCIYFVPRPVAGAHAVAGASKLAGALKNFLLVFRIPLFKQSKSTIKSKLLIISWFLSSFYVLVLINLMVSAGVSVLFQLAADAMPCIKSFINFKLTSFVLKQ